LRISEDDLLPLKLHDHIRMPIVPAIHKLERHWNLARVRTIQMRPQIDFRVCCISPWKFDHFELPCQVQGEEMARMRRTIILAHNSVSLFLLVDMNFPNISLH
jgi:hypothetical protein